jgi:hypothetical protein
MLLVDSYSIHGVTYVIFRVTEVPDLGNSGGSRNRDYFAIVSLINMIEEEN